jgi:sodium/potassium/calcium exchanger 6
LALIGFALAATWIDTIANQLVGTLSFFGALLGIPEPVLGLTVLAWGNRSVLLLLLLRFEHSDVIPSS